MYNYDVLSTRRVKNEYIAKELNSAILHILIQL